MTPHRIESSARAGVTLIECMIAMVVLMVAAQLVSGVIMSTTRIRAVNAERVAAARAARNVLEELHGQDFFDLFALYNLDPSDDPDGAGTGPGAWFDVRELQPRNGEQAVGRITFPVAPDELDPDEIQLREDVDDPLLGMPRDLNADGKVDAEDHAGDYFLLPIQVELRWRGKAGPRSYRVHTMISELRR